MIVVYYRNKYKYQKNWYSWNQLMPYSVILTDLIVCLKGFEAFKNLEHDRCCLYKSFIYFSNEILKYQILEYQILFFDTEKNKFIREKSPWEIGINDQNLF